MRELHPTHRPGVLQQVGLAEGADLIGGGSDDLTDLLQLPALWSKGDPG
jgi:hypothetical protein